MSSVFFTSDLHLGHRKVAEHRGFESIEAHDETIAHNWASTVEPGDLVYVLGDIAVSNPEHALRILSSLPGRKRLIWGNHDQGHPMYRDAWLKANKYHLAFEGMAQSARVKVDGIEVLLSHFPYTRDRAETRFMQWRLPDLGLPLLHGHTHGPETLTLTGGGRIEVHVGLDAWRMLPVADYTVARLIREGRGE